MQTMEASIGAERPEAAAGPLPYAERLVVRAAVAGADNLNRAAAGLLGADGSRERLGQARSVLLNRLHLRSDDLEATLALRIVELALAQAPYPDGPWRWQVHLSQRRVRSTARHRARVTRRARRGRLLRPRALVRRQP